MRRRVCVVVVTAMVAGCWSDDDQINGFTSDQWAQLEQEFRIPEIDRCKLPNLDLTNNPGQRAICAQLAAFGQQLFFDPALSTRQANSTMPIPGTLSCWTCHEPKRWFIDPRTPNNLSLGLTKWTAHNSMATVDLALKYTREQEKAFTWNGKFKSPGSVLELAIAKPFGNTKADVAAIARQKYAAQLGTACSLGVMVGDDLVITCLENALDAFMFQITSLDSPFDQWITGKDDAISTAAKRGFQVFVGRGTCIECHNGPAFSDFLYHDTGVPQTGENVPETDFGRSDVTHLVDDDGKFMTPSLLNVSRTGPYMHDGAFASLEEVVDFYRRGGGDSDYSGVKDPRIMPLDLTDDDARDLVAFLQSLDGATLTVNGMQVDLGSGASPGSGSGGGPGGPSCQQPQTPCPTGCANLQTDEFNCGFCGNVCPATAACVLGGCSMPQTCPPGWGLCNGMCFDLMTDPLNCGACGHVCSTYCMNGVCG